DALRAPVAGGADAPARGVHDRQECACRGQGGRDVRRRGTHGSHGAATRRAGAAREGRHRPAVRPLPERLRATRSRRYPDMTDLNNAESTKSMECWFLTGSQGLYGEETLQQVAAQSARIAEALDREAAIPVRVVWKPVLTETDAIRRMALEANRADECVGVIAWMHTFSPAKMWITGLQNLSKPLLHLHTQANAELPWSEIDMDF